MGAREPLIMSSMMRPRRFGPRCSKTSARCLGSVQVWWGIRIFYTYSTRKIVQLPRTAQTVGAHPALPPVPVSHAPLPPFMSRPRPKEAPKKGR